MRPSRTRQFVVVSLWFLLAVVVATAPAYAQKGKPQPTPSSWVVVDATGKQAGVSFGGTSWEADVLLDANGRVFQLSVASSNLYRDGLLMFDGPYCTGQMYIYANDNKPVGFLTNSWAIVWNGIAYGPDTATAPASHVMFSYFRTMSPHYGQTPPAHCEGTAADGTLESGVVPAVTLMDLSATFTPPFQIKLK